MTDQSQKHQRRGAGVEKGFVAINFSNSLDCFLQWGTQTRWLQASVMICWIVYSAGHEARREP